MNKHVEEAIEILNNLRWQIKNSPPTEQNYITKWSYEKSGQAIEELKKMEAKA